MEVVHVATECAHLAKVGGLGDVIYGLTKQQAREGHNVSILLPFYSSCATQESLCCLYEKILIPDSTFSFSLWKIDFGDISAYFIDIPALFSQAPIYGHSDDLFRFVTFCRAAALALDKLHEKPDIVHLHDWTTAAVPFFQKTVPTIFTIHNIQHQGISTESDLKKMGITPDESFQDKKNPHLYNLMKAAISRADFVSTVSPTYAGEILSKEQGYGLESDIFANKHKLAGILNGIDEQYWSPMHDPFLPLHLPPNFSIDALRSWKQVLRKDLSEKYSLNYCPEKPLLTSVTRLVEQKSPKLIEHALLFSLQKGGQSILLGSAPDEETQEIFNTLQKKYQNNRDIHLHFAHNEKLAHEVFAAADLIVIPSLFEPCGLTQMIAFRYGVVPIVRKTGGLADTVHEENGFLFKDASQQALEESLKEAYATFSDKKAWHTLIENGQKEHYTWHRASLAYTKLYQKALRKKNHP